MTVKQISVFVENKPGMLAELANALNENLISLEVSEKLCRYWVTTRSMWNTPMHSLQA